MLKDCIGNYSNNLEKNGVSPNGVSPRVFYIFLKDSFLFILFLDS